MNELLKCLVNKESTLPCKLVPSECKEWELYITNMTMNYTCKFCLRIWCFKIQSIISKQLTHSCLGSNFLNWKRTHETSLHRKPCVNTQKLLYITFTKQKNVVPIHKFPWVHREFSVSTSVSHLQQPFDQLKLSCVPLRFSVLTHGIFV